MQLFELTHQEKNTRARTGIIHTDHGDIETPIFMPVGTQATVKTLDKQDLESVNAQIILGNTYHLHLRPGEDLIATQGGLHKFMNWDRPILTDSGGFQVFSLGAQKESKQRNSEIAKQRNKEKIKLKNNKTKKQSTENEVVLEQQRNEQLVKIDEEGVTFRSYIDGSKHRFTPESAIDIQHKIGADIIMAFDECTPDDADIPYAISAMERTHRWAARCIDEHTKNTSYHGYRQFLFGIIQGANHKDLRIESAKAICGMNFDGIAVGGESIGYNMEATKDILDWIYPFLPADKPRYTMGVGFSPLDLFDVVEQGVDMFDCVAPTRIARNGALFISPSTYQQLPNGTSTKNPRHKYRIDITTAQFREDLAPIDASCTCFTCVNHTRSYLHHLFKAEEMLAYRLASIHNVYFFLDLMQQIRTAIRGDRFLELKQQWFS